MISYSPIAVQIYGLQSKKEMAPYNQKIPLAHFADRVKIFGDRLYILEKDNEMCVYLYRIVDTS